LYCEVLLQPTAIVFEFRARVLVQEELRPLEDVAAKFHSITLFLGGLSET
jgi:hypothetical protein